jgi:Secretion system C-terminal sorting domain
MMKKCTMIFMFACLANITQAQTWVKDTLEMGANQTNDVYYSLRNGVVKTESNSNWVMALSNQGGTKAGVFTNTRAGINCYNPHKSIADWATITLADTIGGQQYNQDSCWYIGSFNQNMDGSAYDYGWGTYAAGNPNHNVIGDSIYIVKQGMNFLKVRIDSLGGYTRNWTITIGAIGAPIPIPDQTITFSPGTKHAGRNFIYLAVLSAPSPNYFSIVDTLREPAIATWDFVGTKYKKLLFIPQPFPQNYTGILSNGNVKIQKVIGVKLDLAINDTTLASKKINTIGADWKTFNQPASKYEINDSTLSYFVKSNSGLWQIAFDSTSYTVQTTRQIFKKREIFPLAINEINNFATSFGVYPNPAVTEITFTAESKQNVEAVLSITDMTGKIVFAKNIVVQQGLNAWSMPIQFLQNGHYLISIKGTQFIASAQVVKQ